MRDFNYVNVYHVIYVCMCYMNCIGIGIMHSICTRAPKNDNSECMRWFIERVVSEG